MNAFEQKQAIEQLARTDILVWMHTKYQTVHLLENCRAQIEIQKLGGDAIVSHEGRTGLVEFKIERKHTGNLFLETYSNWKPPQYCTLGWMHTLKADVILFYFFDTKDLYAMSFHELYVWAVKNGNMYRKDENGRDVYPEKGPHIDQPNKTLGRCVPIVDVRAAIKVNHYQLAKAEAA